MREVSRNIFSLRKKSKIILLASNFFRDVELKSSAERFFDYPGLTSYSLGGEGVGEREGGAVRFTFCEYYELKFWF